MTIASKARKVVVTGGAGFIGSNLSAALVERGDNVHVIDRDPTFRRETLHKGIQLHEFDIRESDKLIPVVAGADTIFHLAASAIVQESIDNPIATGDNNYMGATVLFDAAVKANVRRVVYASSSAVYGEKAGALKEDMELDPMSPYGLQKLVGEMIARTCHLVYGIEAVSLRYFNVYGPGLDPNGAYARVIGLFLRQKLQGEVLTITGDGSQTRDFVHVRDVVRATIQAGDAAIGTGTVVNIGSGTDTSIRRIAELIGGDVRYIPARFEQQATRADISKARALLAWEPSESLEEGIQELRSLLRA